MVKILILKYCLHTHIKIGDKLRKKNENDKLAYQENSPRNIQVKTMEK